MSNQTTHIDPETTIKALREKITRLEKALAQPRQEPVAWGYPVPEGGIIDSITPEEHAHHEGEYTVPLYTSPPARKPLAPDLEADTGYSRDERAAFTAGWEAAEAAHGVKENT